MDIVLARLIWVYRWVYNTNDAKKLNNFLNNLLIIVMLKTLLKYK